MGDVGRVQDVGSPWDMLLAVPPVVRYYFVGMVIVTVGSIFGIVSPSAFVLDWNSVVGGLQIWRCFFTFFHLGKLSMQTIMLLMILFQQGVYLEKVTFSGSTPDYLFFLGFSGLLILAMDFFFPSYILAESMLFAMLQVWSRHNSNQPCKFLYVLTVKAAYLPLCFVALELVLSGGRMPWALIKGIVAGQVFYFLTEVIKHPSKEFNTFLPLWPLKPSWIDNRPDQQSISKD